jgi:hypothetical protein
MGNLMGSLVKGSQKWTILCRRGGSLQMVSEPLLSLRGERALVGTSRMR